ncbi:MAG: lipoate--protein ligase family protein [Verrucomicrobiota bacterium]|nr:lipoate--protein ligase family protein [Verrucomicrobiota bacterium]
MLHFLELPEGTPIFERLQLEEALLRTDERSVCIAHFGSPRSIVMGISGDPEQLLHRDAVQQEKVPVIRRFSGGGTVIVDEKTLFVTLIFSAKDLPIALFPEPILRWGVELYQKAWKMPDLLLRENDYCLQERKCGGNAQYIRKERWLLHTSFLWDYEEKNMNLLKIPGKQPVYRQGRAHQDFLCRLQSHSGHWQERIHELRTELSRRFQVVDFESSNTNNSEHRKTTHILHL